MPSITPQNRDFLETVAVGVVLTAITTGTLLLVGWLDLGRSLILASLFVAIMAGTAAYKAYHLGRRRPSETFILIVSILISLSMVVAQQQPTVRNHLRDHPAPGDLCQSALGFQTASSGRLNSGQRSPGFGVVSMREGRSPYSVPS